MNTFDLKPLLRSTVGFDELAGLLDNLMSRPDMDDSYPPYNIEKLGEENYLIEIAVAGFSKNDIDITAHKNRLVITGKKTLQNKKERKFLYKGIAERSFEHTFSIADFVRIEDAYLEDGLLKVYLKREVPEEMKPKSITIRTLESNGKSQSKLLEQKAEPKKTN
jgi:molecular chaperone IbpA